MIRANAERVSTVWTASQHHALRTRRTQRIHVRNALKQVAESLVAVWGSYAVAAAGLERLQAYNYNSALVVT